MLQFMIYHVLTVI